ncbi:MAG: AEC family transporter [Gammaproteobacteria bacterium]
MPTELLAELINIIAPVFLIAAIGYAWERAGMPFDTRQLTTLVTWIGTPTLVVSTLLNHPPALSALGVMVLVAVIVHLVTAAMGYLVLRQAGLPRKTFWPSIIFGNCGNMGLPLALFAFGESGLALAIAFFVVSAIGMFTVGQAIAVGRVSWRALARTPVLWAVLFSVTLLATETPLPRWAGNTVDVLGGFTIPVMLLALGASLARLKVRSLGRSFWLGLLRIFGGMAAGGSVGALFGLEGAALGVTVLLSSMPVAVFNYMFAQYYDNQPEEVAGLVVVSTATSFVILPILLPLLI